MTDLIPADQIESIVGATRHRTEHIGRAVSRDQIVYILHSKVCLGEFPDLRDCPFSHALDHGIRPAEWIEDRPVVLRIADVAPWHDRLICDSLWMEGRGA